MTSITSQRANLTSWINRINEKFDKMKTMTQDPLGANFFPFNESTSSSTLSTTHDLVTCILRNIHRISETLTSYESHIPLRKVAPTKENRITLSTRSSNSLDIQSLDHLITSLSSSLEAFDHRPDQHHKDSTLKVTKLACSLFEHKAQELEELLYKACMNQLPNLAIKDSLNDIKDIKKDNELTNRPYSSQLLKLHTVLTSVHEIDTGIYNLNKIHTALKRTQDHLWNANTEGTMFRIFRDTHPHFVTIINHLNKLSEIYPTQDSTSSQDTTSFSTQTYTSLWEYPVCNNSLAIPVYKKVQSALKSAIQNHELSPSNTIQKVSDLAHSIFEAQAITIQGVYYKMCAEPVVYEYNSLCAMQSDIQDMCKILSKNPLPTPMLKYSFDHLQTQVDERLKHLEPYFLEDAFI